MNQPHQHLPHAHEGSSKPPVDPAAGSAVDPVCGMTVNPASLSSVSVIGNALRLRRMQL